MLSPAYLHGQKTLPKNRSHNSEEKGQKPNFPVQASPPFNEHPMSCAFLYGCICSFVTRQISGAGNSYFENQSALIPRPLDFFVYARHGRELMG